MKLLIDENLPIVIVELARRQEIGASSGWAISTVWSGGCKTLPYNRLRKYVGVGFIPALARTMNSARG